MNEQRPAPRLSPPPRVPSPSHEPRGGRQPASGRRLATIGLFAVLFAALAAVFVVLPRWQTNRTVQRPDPTPEVIPASPTAIPPTPPPTATAPPATRATPVPARVDSPPPPARRPAREEQAYAAAMTNALDALDAGRWDEARAALEEASRLRADAPEIADARTRLEAGERRQTIATKIEQAGDFEKGERWREAERVYGEVLEMAPANAPAIEGRDRAAGRAELDEALAYHASHPDRLVSDSVFEEAQELLETARGIEPGGPRLEEQIERLQAVLVVASKPVAVVFESDNQTEVMVYKVGRLGTFERRELSLRPGTYTVVGSREGYRDVRLRVRVAHQSAPQSVVVRCEEAL
jgi:hypothetical protein